jgi:3-isopropylmalate/(R)-2-methylmalate dehydratase large subunit
LKSEEQETIMPNPKTLIDKVWESHIVAQEANSPSILYIDLHLVHEVTSPQAFTGLRERNLKVRRPERTLATMDHSTPTTPLSVPMIDDQAASQLKQLVTNCTEFGITLFDRAHKNNGIVHVVAPELGYVHPGMTIVCGDSHTSTHGAFGSLAFGIGTSEVEHVLATQCLLQHKPKTFEVRVEGTLQPGVSAKDIILALIAEIGIGGGTGHVFEFIGSAIKNLSMEERMTVCNMSIEGGARAGMVAPDQTTFEYLEGRENSPKGKDWDAAIEKWKQLASDEGAKYDKSIVIDANTLEPMITYGTNPGMGIYINGTVPNPKSHENEVTEQTLEKSLAYMNLSAGQQLIGHKIDVVFLGSCTNSRISDLRQAAKFIKGKNVADGVRMMVVPGSQSVKRIAEQEGLDKIFTDAGAEWREAGCSMCIAMNGDQLKPGQYSISTSNRNFEGRQGKGGRTFLASPLTATASAIKGEVADIRTMMEAN